MSIIQNFLNTLQNCLFLRSLIEIVYLGYVPIENVSANKKCKKFFFDKIGIENISLRIEIGAKPLIRGNSTENGFGIILSRFLEEKKYTFNTFLFIAGF